MIDIKQCVISHKTIDSPIFENRTICYVNKNIKKENKSNCLNTWEKDNIDDLNKYYCELTALYWMWKNIDAEYISLEHYRRLFISSKHKFSRKKFLSRDEIEEIFKDNKFKIIMPYKVFFKKSIYQEYCIKHNKEDIDCLKQQIELQYPSYLDSFNKIMNGHEVSLCNMFVMKKEDMDKYCKFAFDLLDKVFEIRKEDILKRDKYQQRSIGFIAERLFNIYVDHNFKEDEIYRIGYNYFDSKFAPFVEHDANIIYKFFVKPFVK